MLEGQNKTTIGYTRVAGTFSKLYRNYYIGSAAIIYPSDTTLFHAPAWFDFSQS